MQRQPLLISSTGLRPRALLGALEAPTYFTLTERIAALRLVSNKALLKQDYRCKCSTRRTELIVNMYCIAHLTSAPLTAEKPLPETITVKLK